MPCQKAAEQENGPWTGCTTEEPKIQGASKRTKPSPWALARDEATLGWNRVGAGGSLGQFDHASAWRELEKAVSRTVERYAWSGVADLTDS